MKIDFILQRDSNAWQSGRLNDSKDWHLRLLGADAIHPDDAVVSYDFSAHDLADYATRNTKIKFFATVEDESVVGINDPKVFSTRTEAEFQIKEYLAAEERWGHRIIRINDNCYVSESETGLDGGGPAVSSIFWILETEVELLAILSSVRQTAPGQQ